ncbi:hypothetical protein ROHU_016915 [Labeo rohita]|uniref:Uncharacterized protein n=1 Tax=Labeo rohita TaxID=84645 RepID=A0A498NIQ7_LABRO|nr:hypothetical protein ROHU_016915 [Labeo rohita]
MKKLLLLVSFAFFADAVPDPGLSAGYIVLICLCVLLLVAAALGVMCYMLKYSKKWKAIPEPGLPTGYIVLICVLLFVVVALGVIYCMFKYCKLKVIQVYSKEKVHPN